MDFVLGKEICPIPTTVPVNETGPGEVRNRGSEIWSGTKPHKVSVGLVDRSEIRTSGHFDSEHCSIHFDRGPGVRVGLVRSN